MCSFKNWFGSWQSQLCVGSTDLSSDLSLNNSWCLLCPTGPAEPLTPRRLPVLSLLQPVCSISPVSAPSNELQTEFHPEPELLLHLSSDTVICCPCGWCWTEISHARFNESAQTRPDWSRGRRQWRRETDGMKKLRRNCCCCYQVSQKGLCIMGEKPFVFQNAFLPPTLHTEHSATVVHWILYEIRKKITLK